MRTPNPTGIKATTEKNFLIYFTNIQSKPNRRKLLPRRGLKSNSHSDPKCVYLKTACEWLFLSVSISQTLQEAANFSWLRATLGFTQLTSAPLCVPLGSFGSPDEDSVKAMAFAESQQDPSCSARVHTSPKLCGLRAGRLCSVSRRRGGGSRAPRHPSQWGARQVLRRPFEHTAAVAGAGGAHPPPRTARRPKGGAWNATPQLSQPPLPADSAVGPVPPPREAPAIGTPP